MPTKTAARTRAVWFGGIALVAFAATAIAAHGALLSGASRLSVSASPGVVEAKWNMPVDAWGTGRAFVCDEAACGAQVRLYARTKAGFCNCYQGVADDYEIDRIGDVDMHGDDFRPLADGETTTLGELAGRDRRYETLRHNEPSQNVLTIVVSEDCKAIVATLVSKQPT